MKKLIVAGLTLLVVGVLAYRLAPGWRAAFQPSEDAGRVKTAQVIQTNINFAVNAAGEIGPAEQVSVRPEINGRLEELPVDIGDRVKRDDLLFKLDDKELQQQRLSNLTAIERARLELAKAERDYARAQELLEADLISRELYDNTMTTFELAKNSLDRTQKELALIDERLTKTEVRAPFDCTVLTRPVSVGQAVSGSGGFNSGTEVLSIADLNYMVINAHINQADVPRLSVNQSVEVGVEAVSGLVVTGVVERIAPQATIKNNIKGFAARIRIENPDARIRPGMTANIKIPVASAENVVAVPLVAVFTEKTSSVSAERERYVFVTKGGSFERRAVKVGVSDYFFAEIQAGLAPGDVVALEVPKEVMEKLAEVGGPQSAAAPKASPSSASVAASPAGSRPLASTTASGNTGQTATSTVVSGVNAAAAGKTGAAGGVGSAAAPGVTAPASGSSTPAQAAPRAGTVPANGGTSS